MARATTSLPVPVSPTSSTLAGVGATSCTSRATSRMAGDSPTIPGNKSPSSLSSGSDHLMRGAPPGLKESLFDDLYNNSEFPSFRCASERRETRNVPSHLLQAQRPDSQPETEHPQGGQHAARAQQ